MKKNCWQKTLDQVFGQKFYLSKICFSSKRFFFKEIYWPKKILQVKQVKALEYYNYKTWTKVLDKLSAKGTMAYISVFRGRLRCALQSNFSLVSLDNLGGLHFNFVGKNIERKKHATSRECLQFTMHRKVMTVVFLEICDDLFQIEFCRERIQAMFKLEN